MRSWTDGRTRSGSPSILRVGADVARARGPFGRRMTDQDAQTLALVAQLLESTSEMVEDNPLNANVAI